MFTSAAPGINKTINFQGKMTDDQGLNVTDGTYQFVFSLYTVSSGGSATWTETVNLDVADGIFQHNLGSSTSLPGSVDFNTDNIFLGITFNSDPDGEMTPRIQLSASPYAFNSDQLDGLDASDFVQLNPSLAQTGSIDITGSVTAAGGATVSGGAISLNDSSNFVTNINTGISTGAVNIGNANAGLLTFQSGAGIYLNNSVNAPTNINTGTSTGDVNIGNPAAGAVAIQSGTGLYFNYSVNASSYINGGTSTGGVTIGNPAAGAVAIETTSGIFLNNSVNGSTNINTGSSTGTVNIGNNAAGDVTVTSGGTIRFRGNASSNGLDVGSLLGTSLNTFQFSGSTTDKFIRTSSQGSSNSSSFTIITGNSGGTGTTSGSITLISGQGTGTGSNSGGITIDSGSATGTAGTVSIAATNASSLILGRTGLTTLNNGSLTVAQNLTVDTNTLFVDATNNRVGIGTATPSSTTVFNVYGTVPDVSTGSGMLINSVMGSNTFSQTGIRYTPSASPTSASTVDYTGALFGPTANNANVSGASLIGASAQPYVDGTTSLNLVEGFRARVYNDGTGTIAGAVGMRIQNPFNDGTITNNYGLIINTQTAGTNDYGLYIQGADTYALWVDAGTVRFDGDVVLNASLPTGDNNTQVCRASTGILSTCTGGGGSGDILNGGNTGAITIGTNNATSLTLETNNQSAVTVASGGAVQFKNATNSTTALQVTNTANNDVFWVDTTGTYGRVHAANLTLSGSSATSVSFTTPQGSSVITKFLIPLHDPGGGGQHVAMGLPAGAVTNSRAISLFDNRSAGNNQPVLSILSPNESNIFGLNTDGSNTVGWLKGVGMNVGMRVGTTDFLQTVSSTGNLQVGTSDTTAQQLILDTRTSSGDPTGVNGGMYYNSNANAFRFYQNGAWVSLGTGDILNNGQNGAVRIGSNNANSLILETNNTARLTIDSSGDGVFAGNLSSPGTGRSEKFGVGAIADGDSVAFGQYAEALNGDAVALGFSAKANGLLGSTAVGYAAISSGLFSIAIGNEAAANNDDSIVIGHQSTDDTYSSAIILGNSITATSDSYLNIGGILKSSNYATGNLVIGTSDTTAQQLVLDIRTSSGDPTGVNGGMYYNSNAGKFRCYEGGAWKDCITAGGGGSLFTDGGTQTYLTSTGDTLMLGTTSSLSAKLAVVGTTNQAQLLIRANGTQTSPLILLENSSGTEIGRLHTDGTNNLFGTSAGVALTTGYANNAFGTQSLHATTDGFGNNAFGDNALWSNTTGDYNTAMGSGALYTNTTGNSNVAIGGQALASVNESENTAIGRNALTNLTNGWGNVAIGFGAGDNLTSGNENIIIGAYLDHDSSTGSNQLNIAGLLRSSNYSTGNLVIGSTDATGQLLVLDTKNTSGDPTGVAGSMYYNSATDRLRFYRNGSGWQEFGDITQNGNYYGTTLRLGTNDAQSLVLETNNTTRITITSSGDTTIAGTVAVGSFGTASGNHLCYDGSNRIATCTSSRTQKHAIESSQYGIESIRQLQSVSYAWNDSNRQDIGFIAEDVALIIPETTQFNADGSVRSFSYDPIVSVLTRAVQQLDVVVQEDKVRLTVVEENVAALSSSTSGFATSASIQSLIAHLSSRIDVLEAGNFLNLTVSGSAMVGGDLSVTGAITTSRLNLAGKLVTSGAQPTGTVLGSSTIGKTVTVTGNDTAGEIELVLDAGAAVASGQQVSIQFASPFGAKPRVNLTPISEDAADIRYYVEPTPTGFTIFFTSAPSAGDTYKFNYFVVQ